MNVASKSSVHFWMRREIRSIYQNNRIIHGEIPPRGQYSWSRMMLCLTWEVGERRHPTSYNTHKCRWHCIEGTCFDNTLKAFENNFNSCIVLILNYCSKILKQFSPVAVKT